MSDKFVQFINDGDPERQKNRVTGFINQLPTDEGQRWQVTVTTFKQSKTLEQLAYYFGVVIPCAMEYCGHNKEETDEWLRNMLIEPRFVEVMGKTYEIRPQISKMKVNQMSKYIDDVINYLGLNGVPVPAPEYRDWTYV